MTVFSRIALVLMLTPAAALPSQITWTVNASLDDGATVTGSFVYDPDLAFQALTTFNINITAATPGTLTEPFDFGLPTSTFVPFDFTPANSTADGPNFRSRWSLCIHLERLLPRSVSITGRKPGSEFCSNFAAH